MFWRAGGGDRVKAEIKPLRVKGLAWNSGIRRRSLFNERFGRLLVISPRSRSMRGRTYYWLCRCDCGKVKLIWGCNLIYGRVKSCGCLRSELWMQWTNKPDHERIQEFLKKAETKKWSICELRAEVERIKAQWQRENEDIPTRTPAISTLWAHT